MRREEDDKVLGLGMAFLIPVRGFGKVCEILLIYSFLG